MDTEIKLDTNGSTKQIAFADAVAKLGVVDLLKLDCEGAEWNIFSDSVPWAKVHRLCRSIISGLSRTRPFDRWKPCLRDLGFNGIVTRPSMNGRWALPAGKNKQASLSQVSDFDRPEPRGSINREPCRFGASRRVVRLKLPKKERFEGKTLLALRDYSQPGD
jgi:hypothetical protein